MVENFVANLFMSYQNGWGAVLAQKRLKNGIGVSVWVTKWQMMGFARLNGFAVSMATPFLCLRRLTSLRASPFSLRCF